MSRLERVFIDTNELFPFTVMDVLLTFSENFLFTWVWTDELLAEWERVIVANETRTSESARSVAAAVRAHFGAGRIDPAAYRDRITEDLSSDPDDRAHVAACLDGRVDVLLTRNAKDFPADLLADAGVSVMPADRYLLRLLQRRPKAVTEFVLRRYGRGPHPPAGNAVRARGPNRYRGSPRICGARTAQARVRLGQSIARPTTQVGARRSALKPETDHPVR